jgi:hypothetical protein
MSGFSALAIALAVLGIAVASTMPTVPNVPLYQPSPIPTELMQ